MVGIGLNGANFNIELPKVRPDSVFVDNKIRINHIVQNSLINKAGVRIRLVLPM
jgi:hypothetical protein